MRNKKLWKILGTSAAIGVVLLLLFVVAFIFNPFEGSLPDVRGLVPRDADWYVRKADLRDDFADFPEPEFWSRFRESSSWQTLQRSEFVRSMEQPGGLGDAIDQLRRVSGEVSAQSGGFVSLERQKVYFFGIIDVLERYNVRWRLQRLLTSSAAAERAALLVIGALPVLLASSEGPSLPLGLSVAVDAFARA